MLNLHIYPSNMTNESRMFKITSALIEDRIVDDIILIGIQELPSPENEVMDAHRTIWRVPLTKWPHLNWKIEKILRYIEWIFKIYCKYRKQAIAMINCHSLFDLPVGVLLKKKTGCKLIYDTHELETERNGLKGLLKRILKIIEKWAVRHVDHIFTVGDSIAQWYVDTYSLNCVSVIKNIPLKNDCSGEVKGKSSILRDLFSIPLECRVYLYQGAFLNGRGIEILLSVFSGKGMTDHIVFMGYGPLSKMIQTAVSKNKNIHFLEAVPHDQIIRYTSGADIGFALIENSCLSYYYCLPNKLFEYVFSGIPMIASDFPDMKAFVNAFDCGWVTSVDEESVYRLLLSITASDILQKQEQIEVLLQRKDFGWEHEKVKLVDVYRAFRGVE